MSDQPKPTTGRRLAMASEWTADHVRSLLATTPMSARDEVIAAAINAAIAAERGKGGFDRMDMPLPHPLAIRVAQLEEQLAAERKKVETLTKALVEFENEYPHVTTLLREEYAKFHGDDYADMDAARKRILDLEDELHDEREKYERSQEKVRLYFDLLAAERDKAKKQI